jgi:hypothetical protein
MDELQEEVRNVLLERIKEAAEQTHGPGALRNLAEAWAWVTSPNQPHGGTS